MMDIGSSAEGIPIPVLLPPIPETNEGTSLLSFMALAMAIQARLRTSLDEITAARATKIIRKT